MRKSYVLAAVCGAAGLLFAANFHIFTSSDGLPMVVPRVTPGFGEFIVNADALVAMPSGVRMMRFPLSSLALQQHWSRQIDEAREIANKP